MSGAGAVYNVRIDDKVGNIWFVKKKFTDFEVLHKRLKGITWSDSGSPVVLEPAPPFPAKVCRRPTMTYRYIKRIGLLKLMGLCLLVRLFFLVRSLFHNRYFAL